MSSSDTERRVETDEGGDGKAGVSTGGYIRVWPTLWVEKRKDGFDQDYC